MAQETYKQLNALQDEKKQSKAYKRMLTLFDESKFYEIDAFVKSKNHTSEVITGFGYIEGKAIYAFSQNRDVHGGAMSPSQASKIKKIYNLALKSGTPVIGIFDSNGADLSDRGGTLAAYGDILHISSCLSGVVPQIAIIAGPCIGSLAMIAATSDLVVLAEKAELGLEISGENADINFALQTGIAHLSFSTDIEAIQQVRTLIELLPSNNLEGTPIEESGSHNSNQTFQTAQETIHSLADENSIVELSAAFGDHTITVLAKITGISVGIISYEQVLGYDSCAKSARFVRFCDAFSLPLISLINADQFSSLREATKLAGCYAEATTSKITLITGKAYGLVYTALAGHSVGADMIFAWPFASIAPLAPETAAIFEWGKRLEGSKDPIEDRKKLIEEYKKTETSTVKAASDGLIEGIISPENSKEEISNCLQMLLNKRVTRLPKKHNNMPL